MGNWSVCRIDLVLCLSHLITLEDKHLLCAILSQLPTSVTYVENNQVLRSTAKHGPVIPESHNHWTQHSLLARGGS